MPQPSRRVNHMRAPAVLSWMLGVSNDAGRGKAARPTPSNPLVAGTETLSWGVGTGADG
jgi:hypothetical protein